MSHRRSWGSNKPARRKGYRTLRYWADTGDGRGYMRHTVTVRGTKRDGDRRLAELEVAYGDDRPCPTVAWFYENWYLKSCEERISEGKYKRRSLDTMMSHWRSAVGPRWGSLAASGVRPLDVQEWLYTMTGPKAEVCLSLLKQILDFAKKYEAIPSNPCSNKFFLPSKAAKQESATWGIEDLDAIWGAYWGEPEEASVILQAFGLARVGESLAPRCDEVWFEQANGITVACVPLTRQLLHAYGMTEDGDMKNEQSVRVSVIPEPWSLRIRQIAERGAVYLCDDGTGEPLGRDANLTRWRERIGALPIRYGTPRCLRASCRTFLEWHTDIDYHKLEKLMGHVEGDTTAKHYNKPRPDDLIDVVSRAFAERPVESKTWRKKADSGYDWDK